MCDSTAKPVPASPLLHSVCAEVLAERGHGDTCLAHQHQPPSRRIQTVDLGGREAQAASWLVRSFIGGWVSGLHLWSHELVDESIDIM